MAGNGGSLQQPPPIQQENQALKSLYRALDPKSLILSQFGTGDSDQPHFLQLTTESGFYMERGRNYKAYAELRESRLRMKRNMNAKPPVPVIPEPERSVLTPPKKQVKFQNSLSFNTPPRRTRGASSLVAQSVPDFSSALRKENRKPRLPVTMEKSLTPPAGGSKSGKLNVGKTAYSVNSAGEKRSGGDLTARKSFAFIDQLKGLASAAGSAINDGENRGAGGGRTVRRVLGRSVSGYRQY